MVFLRLVRIPLTVCRHCYSSCTFSKMPGVPGEAEEADIAKEVSELEADFKDVLGELDDQANTGDEEDDQKIDEDLGEDKELIAELEADENNVV